MENWGQALRRLLTGVYVLLGAFFLTQALVLLITLLRPLNWLKNLRDSFPWLFYGLLVLIGIYVICRFIFLSLKTIKSRRPGLLILAIIGTIYSIRMSQSHLPIVDLETLSLGFLLKIFLLILAHILIYTWFLRWRLTRKDRSSKFLSDNVESDELPEDSLNVKASAENFADQVVNNFSSDSLVFGLDAPWGSGKTTYLGFARKSWKKHGDKVIVFDFNPQSFDIDTNLFDKFVDEFNKTLKKNHFVPEIQANLFNYLKFLKDSDFDLKFLRLSLPMLGKGSDPLEELRESLKVFNKKVIVIIDDLDRLPVEDIKIILNIVKKSFVLPNVSYILCYDTENINAFENRLVQTRSVIKLNNVPNGNNTSKIEGGVSTLPMADNRKVGEFFEKVVNVKISLFPNPESLKDFMLSGLKDIGLKDNSIKSLTEDSINKIFHPDLYHHYRPFIGDLRKIKRFLNTLVLLNRFNEVDFSIYDYNGKDFVNLILIYINYPHIFRKIYDTEANGGKHFFSAMSPYEVYISGKDDKKFYNSPEYFAYLDTLNESEKKLVEEVFTVNKRLEDTEFSSVDPQILKTYACFNGTIGTGKNLDFYLGIIVDGKLPPLSDNYKFYLGQISELKSKDSLEEVIGGKEEFDLSKGEKNHIALFNAISEAKRESLGSKDIQKILRYILEHLPDYSLLHNPDGPGFEGYRDDLAYKIVSFLDRGGWQDENGGTFENVPKNLKQIADWIFGEGNFRPEDGILRVLSKPERGLLGLYDLTLVRLFCSHDRQGSHYNLYTALAKHFDENAKTEGLITDLAKTEMREISQFVFSVFKDRYISSDNNFIKEAAQIPLRDLMGKTYPLFEKLSDDEKKLVEERAERVRNKIISFIIYQLSNSMINMGVGAGYYDPTGDADKHGVRSEMNKYLFETCFDLDKDINNAEYFVDFLLINFSKTFGEDKIYKLLKDVVEEILDHDKLVNYWVKNRDRIKKALEGKEKNVRTMNYDLIYSEALPKLYKELDKIAGAKDPSLN